MSESSHADSNIGLLDRMLARSWALPSAQCDDFKRICAGSFHEWPWLPRAALKSVHGVTRDGTRGPWWCTVIPAGQTFDGYLVWHTSGHAWTWWWHHRAWRHTTRFLKADTSGGDVTTNLPRSDSDLSQYTLVHVVTAANDDDETQPNAWWLITDVGCVRGRVVSHLKPSVRWALWRTRSESWYTKVRENEYLFDTYVAEYGVGSQLHERLMGPLDLRPTAESPWMLQYLSADAPAYPHSVGRYRWLFLERRVPLLPGDGVVLWKGMRPARPRGSPCEDDSREHAHEIPREDSREPPLAWLLHSLKQSQAAHVETLSEFVPPAHASLWTSDGVCVGYDATHTASTITETHAPLVSTTTSAALPCPMEVTTEEPPGRLVRVNWRDGVGWCADSAVLFDSSECLHVSSHQLERDHLRPRLLASAKDESAWLFDLTHVHTAAHRFYAEQSRK